MSQPAVLAAPNRAPVGRPGDPCVMVIFGASGDLTRRKLIPALYNLAIEQLLSREFAIVGLARAQMTTEQFREKVSQDMKQFATGPVDSDLWEWFVRRMHYVAADFNDPAAYTRLNEMLEKVDKDHATHGNYFFYLATAPNYFGPVIEHLGKLGLVMEDNRHWRRVIIEKPFGRDLESAKALNQQIQQVLDEKQIYRIDHYLGKETVQNILAFRFANGIFEPVWNRRYIDHVRWADVPFYLRTGKALPVRNTHIVIQFRRAPFVLFRETPVENLTPNQLVLHIQPEEGISLRFAAKTPGSVMRLGTVDMNFEYADYFGVTPSTGYERLLHDCMIGDATLFQRADMVEAGWCVVSPVLDVWKALPPRNFPNYAAGTWGPKEADDLLERDGRRWSNFEK